MKHELPKLSYALDALSPQISQETLEYHYGKHHRAYLEKLNELIQGTEFEKSSLEEIVVRADGPIFNNGAQGWNHSFFWNCMRPASSGSAESDLDGALLDAIRRDFGGVEPFKETFSKQAVAIFGSGWAWLCKDPSDGQGKLSIFQASNADNPMRYGKIPLLTLDVWEHAYYIDYRNSRSRFVESFWEIANWDFVKRNYERKEVPEALRRKAA